MIRIKKKKNPIKYKSYFDQKFIKLISDAIIYGNVEYLFKALNYAKIGNKLCDDCKEEYWNCYCEGDKENSLRTYGVSYSILNDKNKLSDFATNFAIKNLQTRSLDNLFVILTNELDMYNKRISYLKEKIRYGYALQKDLDSYNDLIKRLKFAISKIKNIL